MVKILLILYLLFIFSDESYEIYKVILFYYILFDNETTSSRRLAPHLRNIPNKKPDQVCNYRERVNSYNLSLTHYSSL